MVAKGKLLADVQLGDMVFNTVDSLGVEWIITGIAGWWDLPDAEIPNEPLSKYEDGSYTEDGRYRSLQLKMEGGYISPSIAVQPLARRALNEAVDSVRTPTTLRCNEYDGEKFRTVRYFGDMRVEPMFGTTTLFSFSLLAADPRKYSWVEHSASVGVAAASSTGRTYNLTFPRVYPASSGGGGFVTLTNAGNAVTYPTITVTGPASDMRFTNTTTGEYLQVNMSLSAGDQLVVDMKEHRVTLNGSGNRNGAVSFGSTWWGLAPGANSVVYTASATTGPGSTALFRYRDAWIA